MLRRFCLLLLLAFVPLCAHAQFEPQKLVFPAQNCQCQLPYAWEVKNNPAFLVYAHRPIGGSLFITAQPTQPGEQIDDRFIQAVKDRLKRDGREIVDENKDAFEGYPAYTYTMRKTDADKPIYTHSVNLIVGKFRYALVITLDGSDPTQDAELLAALNSFSILTPPAN